MVNWRDITLFVLDMDGTVYLGERLLPGAGEFIGFLKEKEIPFLFFTNNSSRNKRDYVAKLGRLGISIDEHQVMTSTEVMIDYLKAHHPDQAIHLLGTPACEAACVEAGIEVSPQAKIAVAAFDTTLTYDKLVAFCDLLREGVPFYATHPDLNCPVEGGFIPDLGAMLALIEKSTGRTPLITGKPYAATVEAIQHLTSIEPKHMAFIGDRLYTDMKVAKDNGATALLVLSGETTKAMLEASDVTPDGVFSDLADLSQAMAEAGS
ncbi:MAG TPA: HAD-IIA family hydrolase [Fastidiosipila sp.]|jgi:4-nitrophenyl phosphatase|nr:HAD-IIA family hydrolase [Fastidiosipila sp.]